MRMQTDVLVILAFTLLISNSVQGVPYNLPEISKSASLILDALSTVSNGPHLHETAKCNDKKITNFTTVECNGIFEIEIRREEREEEHSHLKVECHGQADAHCHDEDYKMVCDGKYVLVFEKILKEKNHTKEETYHTLKCSDKYHLEKFEKGDALMNETCEGNLEEIDRYETFNKNGSHVDLVQDDKQTDLQDTICIAKCDGVEVELNYPFPCSGVYSLACSSSNSQKKEVCDGTFRATHGTNCRGAYSTTVSSKVNKVTQRCNNYFSSLQHRKQDLRSRFDHCSGSYSYVTVRTSPKSQEVLLE